MDKGLQMKTEFDHWCEPPWPEERGQLAGPGMKSADTRRKFASEFELEVIVRLKSIEDRVDSLIEELKSTASKHRNDIQTSNKD